MDYKIVKWGGGIDASATGAKLAVKGKLQIYVCHDGTLEVYLDGKDIKEALGIDVSSAWFDFGDAVLAVETSPGEETEMRPKDFGKVDLPEYWGSSQMHDDVASVFEVPASHLDPKNPTFIEEEPENFIEKEPALPGDPEFEIPF